MTKQTKQYALWGALILGAAYLYARSRGTSIFALLPFGSTGGSTGLGVNPSGGAGSGSTRPIVTPDIVALRGAATGPLSRHMCALPSRWINTTTGPYYGFCVTQSQFNEWVKQSDAAQSTATEQSVRAYFASRGGI